MSENIDLIQMKVTKDRSKEWKRFKERSRYPMTSDQVYEAIVFANKYLDIKENGKQFIMVDPELLE